MNKLKNLVKMSADEYNEMVQNGSVDIGGTLVSFDVGNLCLVPEEPIVIDTTLSNAGQAADAGAVGTALENKYSKVDGIDFGDVFGNGFTGIFVGDFSGDGFTAIEPNKIALYTDDGVLGTEYYHGRIHISTGEEPYALILPLENGTILTDTSGYKKVDGVSIIEQMVETFANDSNFTRIYPYDGLLAVTDNEGAWFVTNGIGFSGDTTGCDLKFPVADTVDGVGLQGTIATQEYVQENAGGKLYQHRIYIYEEIDDEDTSHELEMHIVLYNTSSEAYTIETLNAYLVKTVPMLLFEHKAALDGKTAVVFVDDSGDVPLLIANDIAFALTSSISDTVIEM